MQFRSTDRYVAPPDLALAVNAAVTLERPLLVKGEPGTRTHPITVEITPARASVVDTLQTFAGSILHPLATFGDYAGDVVAVAYYDGGGYWDCGVCQEDNIGRGVVFEGDRIQH